MHLLNLLKEKERQNLLKEMFMITIKLCYMADKVGQEFDGTISSVTNFGMFVELDNTVEGLVRLANMADDYYIYDDMTYTIIGERTKKTFRIGDPVRIRVDRVNVDFREIDFELLEKIDDAKRSLVALGWGVMEFLPCKAK